MDEMIAVAKSFTVDCRNVEKKFRQLVDLTEDEAHFHMKQSAFLYHLGTQTMPKSLHCLSMRLTVEYFKSVHVGGKQQTHSHKLDSLDFRHYAIFSRNILAASVVINYTMMYSEGTRYMVFHILTDRQGFFAMKHWFARNSYMKAAIHVKNIDDLNLNPYDLGRAQLSPSEEFRISVRNSDYLSPMQMKTEYVSVFGLPDSHSRTAGTSSLPPLSARASEFAVASLFTTTTPSRSIGDEATTGVVAHQMYGGLGHGDQVPRRRLLYLMQRLSLPISRSV